ncbi:hypothetical protein FV139_15420 [Parahaliea maris]|uniref:HD/PDEase domain-containing protein n=1 Tax=Parahaliea maris TaxID=2716870 RepID=A0A5C8ZXZ4_9GAMM|nr:hypothetical protein [Parahaliea maris]TXS92111.1 hypothetical protein FV139_15420 [Parahaliea maris]
MSTCRAPHLDVSESVDVTRPAAVAEALCELFSRRYPGHPTAIIERLVDDFARLYRGDYPGFHACDVKYHDVQHVLDVTLAMARLMDGYEQAAPEAARLGPEQALTGICAALFHDAGYIRRTHDTRHGNGAAYTRIHVNRSARWLREYLPGIGLGRLAGPASRIVMFTNCSRDPATVPTRTPAERLLGELLGTADLMAQLADVCYVQKCRDYLFDEFVEGGIAGSRAEGYLGSTYRTANDLLKSTPAFIRWAIRERLEEGFHGAYHYVEPQFGGANPYMEAIADNYARLEASLSHSASA